MKESLVINVQKCSIHDGPGIRTTIFFKGCPLKCAWCHNPESQNYKIDFMYDPEKCVRCQTCIDKCHNNAIYCKDDIIGRVAEKCDACGECTDWCLTESRELVGKTYTRKELMKIIEKDRMFYEESGGGVTLSGGEVMSQDMNFISEIIDSCREKGISVAVDTCGYAPTENFEKISGKVDVFLYDIKLMNEEKHIKFTGKSNRKILENLKYLSDSDEKINIRIPLIEGVNVDDENLEIMDIINFLKLLKIESVSLLPYHDIMKNKYRKLGMEYEGGNFKRPDEEKLEEIKNLFEKENFNVKIGG